MSEPSSSAGGAGGPPNEPNQDAPSLRCSGDSTDYLAVSRTVYVPKEHNNGKWSKIKRAFGLAKPVSAFQSTTVPAFQSTTASASQPATVSASQSTTASASQPATVSASQSTTLSASQPKTAAEDEPKRTQWRAPAQAIRKATGQKADDQSDLLAKTAEDKGKQPAQVAQQADPKSKHPLKRAMQAISGHGSRAGSSKQHERLKEIPWTSLATTELKLPAQLATPALPTPSTGSQMPSARPAHNRGREPTSPQSQFFQQVVTGRGTLVDVRPGTGQSRFEATASQARPYTSSSLGPPAMSPSQGGSSQARPVQASPAQSRSAEPHMHQEGAPHALSPEWRDAYLGRGGSKPPPGLPPPGRRPPGF